MKIELSIDLKFRDVAGAKSIHQSLKPDNVEFPMGLDFDMIHKGKTIQIILQSIGKVETLVSTVDEIMSNCQVSKDSLEIISQ